MARIALRSAVSVLSISACSREPAAGPPAATRLVPAEPSYRWAEARVLESLPPQLVVELKAEMPTPGWSLTVDSVEVDPNAGRIVLRITEAGPSGIVAQVITPTRVQANLGSVPVGRYCLEVWTRRAAQGSYSLAQSLALAASGGAPPQEHPP